jgi:hypothetical protein
MSEAFKLCSGKLWFELLDVYRSLKEGGKRPQAADLLVYTIQTTIFLESDDPVTLSLRVTGRDKISQCIWLIMHRV